MLSTTQPTPLPMPSSSSRLSSSSASKSANSAVDVVSGAAQARVSSPNNTRGTRCARACSTYTHTRRNKQLYNSIACSVCVRVWPRVCGGLRCVPLPIWYVWVVFFVCLSGNKVYELCPNLNNHSEFCGMCFWCVFVCDVM